MIERRARPVTRRLRAACSGAAFALLLACAGGGGEPSDGSRAVSALPETLRIGTSGDYPPFSVRRARRSTGLPSASGHPHSVDLDRLFLGANPNPSWPLVGFEIELAEALARDLDVGIEWVPFRWPELEARVAADAFDVVASGVTWRPARAVTGWMTRATAVGGPCVVGDPAPARVAVNRGGVLERFARARFAGAEILALDDNRALASALARRRADAIVTDSFERAHLGIPTGTPFACEAKTDRKVLWIAPARAAELGPRIDAWLQTHEEKIDAMRVRWLDGSAPRSESDHLLDLLARRLAYMPAVAAWKRERGVAIDDPSREAAVLDAARADARRAGLAPEPVAALFALQIELGKRLQSDALAASNAGPSGALDLGAQIRPELVRLGARIVESAARIAPLEADALDAADWTPLAAWLDAAERARLRAALLAIPPADPRAAAD